MKGRKRVANEIKEARGTARSDRELPALPQEDKLSNLGEAPRYLHGNGKLIWNDLRSTAHPLIKVQNEALKNYAMLCSKLGIDPLTRHKMLAGAKAKDDGDGEDFA